MRSGAICAAGVVSLALGICGSAAAAQAQAPRPQAAQPAFNPARPFANITSAQQWITRFIPGQPIVAPNDPFGNMTSGDFWRGSWQGQTIGHPERTPASIKGSGGHGASIRSPYPYRTAQEHFAAWRAAANGGTRHTAATLPDWSGDWQGGAQGVLGYNARITDIYAGVANAYRPRYVNLLRGEWEGGHQWWPAAFCMPDAFSRVYAGGGVWHFMRDNKMVLINEDRPENATRYVYTDGRGFLPAEIQFPQWYGASQGFWDGDELVIYTSQVKPWVMSHGLPQYSEELEIVERVKRLGAEILVDITLYDPKVFAFPWHDTALFKPVADWTTAPATWTECVHTNNVYMNAKGELAEHAPDEPGYRDVSDEEPWATAYKLWDENHAQEAAHWKGVFDQAAEALRAAR